jgi:hypothetical protein
MLSEALQRNAKHEARLSNISDCEDSDFDGAKSEILRFAQNDNPFEFTASPISPAHDVNRKNTALMACQQIIHKIANN